MSKDYQLIPLDQIDPEAREIAVAWVENFNPAGLDIRQKHKLASDIMNYAASRSRGKEAPAEVKGMQPYVETFFTPRRMALDLFRKNVEAVTIMAYNAFDPERSAQYDELMAYLIDFYGANDPAMNVTIEDILKEHGHDLRQGNI